MRKLLLLSVALVFCLSAPAAFAQTLKLAHIRPQGSSVDIDLTQFAKDVDEATGGKVKMQLYPASALGDYTVVQERVAIGAVEMSCQPAAPGTDKRFLIGFLPFLAKDWAEAEKAWGPGGPVRKEVEKLLGNEDIKVLAAWPVYFSGISLYKEPTEPLNPNVSKKLKVRVPPVKSLTLITTNMGYQGAVIPFSETFTAVQTGVVDGIVGAGAEGYYSSFRDVTKYYVPANLHFEVWYVMINQEAFNSLPADAQKAMMEIAAKMEAKRWKDAPQETLDYEQKLIDLGATRYEVTEEALTEFAKIAQEKVWPEVMDDIGKEWVQGIFKELGK